MKKQINDLLLKMQTGESDSSRYFIAVDPYDRLTWWQNLLKKTGLFYRNRPKSSAGIFIWKEDGTAEWKNYH
jgi:hypothetical protein